MTKFSPVALAALLLVPNSFGLVPTLPRSNVHINTELKAGKNTDFDKIVGTAGAFFTGLVAATQIAFADPSAAVIENVEVPSPISNTQVIEAESSSSITLSAFAGSGSIGGASFETLDFSLPSYSEATKGDVSGSKESGAPTFAPSFPELKLPGESSTPPAEEKSAPAVDEKSEADKEAEKAAAKKAAEEEKAAKKKAAEEEKAAKEKEAAEKAAAAEKRKAELEERKAAEKKKQEEMVAKQIAAKEAADAAAAAAEKKADIPPAPVTPIAAPKPVPAPPKPAPATVPEIKAPDVKVPDFSAPDIKVPDIKLPSFGAISVPKFEAPDTSALPKVDTSKLAVPSFGSSVENKADLEPQEVRDEKAVEAKKKFVDLDLKAQEIERKAVLARDTANEAKKAAKEAKDLACETRFGGKILCIRPFGIGY